jgi:bacterioferritin-associated ferredoxin
MIVCHCKAVSDRRVRQIARDGARTCADIAEACGAGAECGGCHPTIDQILREERPDEAPRLRLVLHAAAAS